MIASARKAAPPSAAAEDALVARARAGDHEAFHELYARHVNRIYGLCLRLTGSAREAEARCQDAFVQAWQGLAQFHGESRFGTWLHRIAVNAVLAHRRRAARWWRRVEDGGRSDPAVTGSGALQQDLHRAVARLPAGARRVLVLHDIEGYSHAEIAQQMGIAVGTCKAQLHRARRLLREWLGPRS